MRQRMRFWMLVVCVVVGQWIFTDPCLSFSTKNVFTSKIDALFSQWDRPDSPGCALAVVRNGDIVYKKGYGMADLEHDVPITPETVFYIGSTSKQFVTMCILLCEEQGKLSLDDDIRKYLTEFPEYDRPINIRHLVHHTSGIRDYLTLWSLAGKDYLDHMDEGAVYDMICRQKELNFSPGERFLYSNSCYFLLALIIQRASGQKLRAYADEHIFRVLEMHRSHFHDDVQHIIKNRAFGYTLKDDSTFGNLHMRFSLVGSGGLYTCVEDLALWDRNFYDNVLGEKRPDLIDKMLTNGKLRSGEELDYAFALRNGMYRGLRTVDHGGALGGYRAQLLRFPEQLFSVIILANLDRFNPTRLAYDVADIYLAESMEPMPEEAEHVDAAQPVQENKPTPPQLSEDEAMAYTGHYYSEELEVTYKIFTDQNQLYVRAGYNPRMKMVFKQKDTFRVDRMTLHFRRDETGGVSGFSVDAGRVTDIKFERSEP